jgi:hypothetical protein
MEMRKHRPEDERCDCCGFLLDRHVPTRFGACPTFWDVLAGPDGSAEVQRAIAHLNVDSDVFAKLPASQRLGVRQPSLFGDTEEPSDE